MYEDWIIESDACAQCNAPMTMLIGMRAPGAFRIMELYPLMSEGGLRGAFKCGLCGGCYCYDCSDANQSCVRCKATNWLERQYITDPAIVAELASRTDVGQARARQPQRQIHHDGSVSLTAEAAGLPPEISADELNRYLEMRYQASRGLIWVVAPAVLNAVVVGWWLSRSWSMGWAVSGGALAAAVSFPMFLMIEGGRKLAQGIVWSCPHCRKPVLITSQDPPSAWLCRTPGCGFSHFQFWKSRQ